MWVFKKINDLGTRVGFFAPTIQELTFFHHRFSQAPRVFHQEGRIIGNGNLILQMGTITGNGSPDIH